MVCLDSLEVLEVVMGADVCMTRGIEWGDNLQPAAKVRDAAIDSCFDEKEHVQ